MPCPRHKTRDWYKDILVLSQKLDFHSNISENNSIILGCQCEIFNKYNIWAVTISHLAIFCCWKFGCCKRFDKYDVWLVGCIKIEITPPDAEHTALATHKDYSDCPRHSSAELYFNAEHTLFPLPKTQQCRTLLLRKNTLYFNCLRQSSAGLYFYGRNKTHFISIVQDTAVQNFTSMQNTLYYNCPRHNAELHFHATSFTVQCKWYIQCNGAVLISVWVFTTMVLCSAEQLQSVWLSMSNCGFCIVQCTV